MRPPCGLAFSILKTQAKVELSLKNTGYIRLEQPIRIVSMPCARIILAVSLAGAALGAAAGVPFFAHTISWDEEVLLADGRTLSIRRTATYRPDEWGRSGRGPLKKQSIHFNHGGQRISWVHQNPWPISYLPDIVDIVGGMPVVVLPVHRVGPCNFYGFPQQGFVAFGYRNGRWERVMPGDLSPTVKVNLLRNPQGLPLSRHKGKRVTPAIKLELEQGPPSWAPQGQPISEASRRYSSDPDACTRLRPWSDPAFETSRQKNAEAEIGAKGIIATVMPSVGSSQTISPGDFRKAKGEWAGLGYVAPSCNATVKTIDPLRQSWGERGWNVVGYTLILRDGTKVPVQKSLLAPAQAPAMLEVVSCDAHSIYAVKQQSKDQLIVHRFSHAGAVLAAYRITLPDVSRFFPDEKWPPVWEVTVADDQLTITLANYSYTGSANLGGALGQQVRYTVLVPN